MGLQAGENKQFVLPMAQTARQFNVLNVGRNRRTPKGLSKIDWQVCFY
jgi:hypothetical protein